MRRFVEDGLTVRGDKTTAYANVVTVLDIAKLSPAQRRAFDALPKHPALLPPEALGPTLLEPHPSWMTRIEAEWQRRFSG